MSNTKRKFIESHWLTFALKGVISIVAGLCLMYTPNNDIQALSQILGWSMFSLACVEIANVIYRKICSHNWTFPFFLGAIELAIAATILCFSDPSVALSDAIELRIAILSGYVLFASVTTIIMGFLNFRNETNRFMWVINGMIGCVLAFMMFGGTNLGLIAHITMFGTYLLVNGITDLFYGIHSKDECDELAAETVKRKKASRKGKGK